MAIIGVKSNIPARGMMRRRGARIGEVILSRIRIKVFGSVKNQDRMTLIKIAKVSNSHRILIKLKKNSTAAYLPSSLARL